jgi:Na+/H+ antiporter NhaA
VTELARPGPPLRVRFPQVSPSLRTFLVTEAGGAALLLAAAIAALVWANSPWSDSYTAFWDTEAGISLGGHDLTLTLHGWVNDAAMALFFLVVGLEISREATVGELRDRRTVAVPALGALGGLAVPALIYLAFNPTGEAAQGWGVAMSTDTAFVVGILALFGPRCPDQLRLFLLTLAIVDDIGAITVLALFYTPEVHLWWLVAAALIVLGLLVIRWLGMWRTNAYVIGGILLWLAVHESGVHATLAGVALGLIVPSGLAAAEQIDSVKLYGKALVQEQNPARARNAVLAAQATVSPNARLQEALHPWTAYVIVPVFGLANAGVVLDGGVLGAALTSPVTIGVAVALVLGNAIGIFAAATLALRLGLGVLPGQVRFSHLVGGAVLAGIGFTISLFIAELAFSDEVLRDQAKIGILIGSLSAAVLGSFLLRFFGERSPLCSPTTATAPPELPEGDWLEPAALAG